MSFFAYSQKSLGIAGARRILELINRETELDQNQAGYQDDMRGRVRFENVSYAYPGADNSLEELVFTIEPGQTVAIVGQTGSGKDHFGEASKPNVRCQ